MNSLFFSEVHAYYFLVVKWLVQLCGICNSQRIKIDRSERYVGVGMFVYRKTMWVRNRLVFVDFCWLFCQLHFNVCLLGIGVNDTLNVLNSLNINKSAGLDELHPAILRPLADILAEPLTGLLPLSIRMGARRWLEILDQCVWLLWF